MQLGEILEGAFQEANFAYLEITILIIRMRLGYLSLEVRYEQNGALSILFIHPQWPFHQSLRCLTNTTPRARWREAGG